MGLDVFAAARNVQAPQTQRSDTMIDDIDAQVAEYQDRRAAEILEDRRTEDAMLAIAEEQHRERDVERHDAARGEDLAADLDATF
jgi:hypothetical protein